MEATDDEVAASVDDAIATDGADSSDSWSPPTCSSRGNGVFPEVVRGPSEARLSPCGCLIAPGYLQRRRD